MPVHAQSNLKRDWLKQIEMLYLQYMSVFTFIFFHNHTEQLQHTVIVKKWLKKHLIQLIECIF